MQRERQSLNARLHCYFSPTKSADIFVSGVAFNKGFIKSKVEGMSAIKIYVSH